eukprot:473543_1
MAKYYKLKVFGVSVVALCTVRFLFWKMYNRFKSYPEGPVGIPFLGCLLQFAIQPQKFLWSVAQYGPITYVPLMTSNNIFISDPLILRELYQKQKIVERPKMHLRPIPTFAGINGKEWDARRNYVNATVMTLAKSSFVLSNVRQCLRNIEPVINKNSLWFPKECIHYISFCNVWASVFGQILPFGDPLITRYCKHAEKSVYRVGILLFLKAAINFSLKIPDIIQWYIVWEVFGKQSDDILLQWMRNNGFVVDPSKNILQRTTGKTNKQKVYIDFMIQRAMNAEISVKTILSDIPTVIIAAIDTTTQAVIYGFLCLAKYPDIQQMVYHELTSVMKRHNIKQFDFSILNELHLFRAFVHEVLRISSVLPIGVPHKTTREHLVHIDGKPMVIPKDCLVHCNTFYMHKHVDWTNNKQIKTENNDIHLEYWLDSNKKFLFNEKFLLFGVGKRDCVGRKLAMKELFAIYGEFVTKYKFSAPNNDLHAIDMTQSFGLVMHTKHTAIQIQKR